jgi:replication-associated recombination protein RarA
MKKQFDLNGEITEIASDNKQRKEELSLWKSVLQKAVRRGNTEKAMYAAYKLVSLSSWSCWKRLSTIADEDVGQPNQIVAVDVLYKKYMAMKKNAKEEITWDMRRCVVCAAKILAEAPKDRRADEFLELINAIERHGNNKELQKKREQLESIPDEALDMHTLQGRRMGRGEPFWYEVSSETVRKTPQYEAWHKWFKPLMTRLVKEKKKWKNGI